MIGNDIIDLAQSRAESNWQRKGFIEKLFTDNEQLLIKQYYTPEIMVWVLWSMKEAAYKIYNRQTKMREYIPKKLICTIDTIDSHQLLGKVICTGNVFYTKTHISSESIHTIAVDNLENINRVIEIQNKEIIKDEYGIPYLKTSNLPREISISHHGRFEKKVIIEIE